MPNSAQPAGSELSPPEHGRTLAVVCDLREENWPSMDLVADKLLLNLSRDHSAPFRAVRVCPSMVVRFGAVPVLAKRRFALNADRMLNRMLDYPRYMRKEVANFDLFHICDHSYAQLVHALPTGRTGVFCHDLDTFKCLLEPEREPRPTWFKAMARRILSGLERAALVFHTTSTVRAQIVRHGLIDPARLIHAPYGIADEFRVEGHELDAPVDDLKALAGAPFLLHVGSCIARKRIDVLLDVFAAIRRIRPGLRLLQVGGEWSSEQRAQLRRHGLQSSVLQLPRMNQARIANLYRRAALVLMPSESEGFGLPVVEALACGSVVIASDIPVFREIGGDAVVYCAMGETGAWVDAVEGLLKGRRAAPMPSTRLDWTRQFCWAEHARRISHAYRARVGAAF